jgi:hypothetical protein
VTHVSALEELCILTTQCMSICGFYDCYNNQLFFSFTDINQLVFVTEIQNFLLCRKSVY